MPQDTNETALLNSWNPAAFDSLNRTALTLVANHTAERVGERRAEREDCDHIWMKLVSAVTSGVNCT
jgi:hypothetical protein